MGGVNHTKSGIPCKVWNNESPSSSIQKPEGERADTNFCSEVGDGKAWCYKESDSKLKNNLPAIIFNLYCYIRIKSKVKAIADDISSWEECDIEYDCDYDDYYSRNGLNTMI